jgi:hypothetical protein
MIDKEEIKLIVNDARKLWQQFVHQPQTGRCFVFILVLGKMVQKITETYNVSINKLTSILELDVSENAINDFCIYFSTPYTTWIDLIICRLVSNAQRKNGLATET